MPADKKSNLEYKTLRAAAKNNGAKSADLETLKPSAKQNGREETDAPQNLINPKTVKFDAENPRREIAKENPSEAFFDVKENARAEITETISYAGLQKEKRRKKKNARDSKLLDGENWFARNNHKLTYAGIFLFTLLVYFRPYELFPALSDLSSSALVVAVATLIIYVPSQIAGENSLLTLTTEVKCLLFIAFWALLTIPVAIDPALAWETFNTTFSKVLAIFIVMVSTVRTVARLKGLMWLGLGAGIMVSAQALYLYQQGIFKTEGYRVRVDSGGMFGNPNDMALHFVVFLPIAITLGLASKSIVARLLYFAVAVLMVGGIVVTQSRGAFLGLIAVGAVLVWKLGKNQRLKAVLISSVAGLVFILAAPGNYALRILSIFDKSLDPVGSAGQRSALLALSLDVTMRHPLGIGMGNFPVVSYSNLQTHNAYTQVSSELGWLAAAAYVLLMVSPVRKLAVVERRLFASAEREEAWIYYLSVGVQASIVGYMVSSFFSPSAYNWYVYYPIAYAVCLRRIYRIRQAEKPIADAAKSSADDDGANGFYNFAGALK